MPDDVTHDLHPDCLCDLCVATLEELSLVAGERTAAFIEDVEAWAAAHPDATAFPWERDCTTSFAGCAL